MKVRIEYTSWDTGKTKYRIIIRTFNSTDHLTNYVKKINAGNSKVIGYEILP